MIRIVELIQTINFFKNMTDPSPFTRSNHEKDNILKELRKFCPSKDLEILDMLSNYENMSKIMSVMKETDSSTDTSNPDGNAMLKHFLNKEQQEKYEEYKKLLNV